MQQKESKDEAHVGFPPPLGVGRTCRNCVSFEPVPRTEDGSGTCSLVYGIQKPENGCLNQVPMDAPQNVPWPYRQRRRNVE